MGKIEWDEQKIRQLAEQEGFTRAALLAVDQLVFDQALRKYCEDNLCGNYGKNYSCPPFCGTPEEMRKYRGNSGSSGPA